MSKTPKLRGKRSAIYGELLTQAGNAQSVEVLRAVTDKGGYVPETLDPILESLIENAAKGSELLNAYTPMLEALMQRLQTELQSKLEELTRVSEVQKGDPDKIDVVLDLASKVSVILERLNRMTMQAVKSKDDATRLRAFLATGDDEGRSGLDQLSEKELRQIVASAAAGFAEPDAL